MVIEAPQLTSETRYERKYRCTYQQYYAVKNALYTYVQPDPYTQCSPLNQYLVRSLYYDSHDFPILLEKINGNCSRLKFRIRTYGDSAKQNPDIRVEIKVRQTNLTKKFGALIDMEACEHFLHSRHFSNHEDQVLVEFERQIHARCLFPKILVEYRREGFNTKWREGVRITFDHKIKCTSARTLFPEKIGWQNLLDPIIVLEIKHSEDLPAWLLNIIRDNNLRMVSNSKFALGMVNGRRDMVFPGWSNV